MPMRCRDFLAAGTGERSALAVDVLPGRIGEDADAVAIVRDDAAAYVDLTELDADAENVLAAVAPGRESPEGRARLQGGAEGADQPRPRAGRGGGRHVRSPVTSLSRTAAPTSWRSWPSTT